MANMTSMCLAPTMILLLLQQALSLRVLVSQMTLEQEAQFLTGARLVNEAGNVTLGSVTLCIRFKFKVLGNSFTRSNAVNIEDRPRVGRMFKLAPYYPSTNLVFGYPQAKDSWVALKMQDPDTGAFNIFDTDAWTHMCAAFDADSLVLRLYKDGRPLNINHREPLLKESQFPPDMLDHVFFGRCLSDDPRCSAPEGEIADFNMWTRALGEDELADWTGCRSDAKGDLVNWDEARFDLINMTVEERPLSSVCSPARPGSVIFPERKPMGEHVDLCYQMGGAPTVVRSREQQDALTEEFHKYQSCKDDWFDFYWNGYWDAPHEGTWAVPVTGQVLDKERDYAPFILGHPNGLELENCLTIHVKRGVFKDRSCADPNCGFCDLERAPKFTLRGLCPGSKFDIQYSWARSLLGGRHNFRGYTSSLLRWDNATSAWAMELYADPSYRATAEPGTSYPFGTWTWTLPAADCGGDEAANATAAAPAELALTSCDPSEFNCRNGYCVDMERRCDGRLDCPDKSDEAECQLLTVDESYLKDVPPPPPPGSPLTPVNISVDVLSILEISEVDGTVAVQLRASLSWYDERVTMYHLKARPSLNTLTTAERGLLWIPQVVFHNTEERLESRNDEKSFATVARSGGFRRSPLEQLDNAYIYQGRENPITISRVYSAKFLCEFDMSVYPFDTQVCSVVFVMKGNTGELARLVKDRLQYLGPIDLTQYFVKDFRIVDDYVPPDLRSVKVELVFGRRLLSTFLTIYLPMMILCIVSFSTNYFKAFFFEAIVTVNLTALLVLTTLFISISDSLPKTNYIKMMDMWCIFNLFVPFAEVIIHTFIDTLRVEDDREINHHGRTVPTALIVAQAEVADRIDSTKLDGTTHGKTRGNSVASEAGGYKADLVSRNEGREVAARRELYEGGHGAAAGLRVRSESQMRAAKMLARVGFPATYAAFVVAFLAVGMANYH